MGLYSPYTTTSIFLDIRMSQQNVPCLVEHITIAGAHHGIKRGCKAAKADKVPA